MLHLSSYSTDIHKRARPIAEARVLQHAEYLATAAETLLGTNLHTLCTDKPARLFRHTDICPSSSPDGEAPPKEVKGSKVHD